MLNAASALGTNESVIDLSDFARPKARERSTFNGDPTISMVYGGGGAMGIAWHLAVINAIEAVGLPVRTAPSIGTSAGSWACGAARLSLSFDDFAGFGALELPDRSPGLLRGLAENIYGDARLDDVRVSVTAMSTMRRHLLDASKFALPDLIAASSAVPGVFSPHMINGRRYVDGGVRAMASADAARAADVLIVSLPIAGSVMGPVGKAFEVTSRRAIARWRDRHHGTTILLRPGKAFARALGMHPGHIMDVELAKSLYPVAYDTVARRLETRIRQIQARAS
ncbi:MAG: hypothetical protein GX868_01275 [Actinobacteria bacterium]|nr:hypothetical protein [Actinomycetota bacterium]